MKKIRWIFIVAICIIAIMLFRACSDDKHITQGEAEKIAKALVGGEVAFIKSEKGDTPNRVDYVFTDAKGNTFTITSSLAKPQIDGATVKVLPLELHVSVDYDHAIVKCNEAKIREILERYGFGDCLGSSFKGLTGIYLKVKEGTPEENQEILKNFVAAGVEIDTLLDMTFDKDYLKNHNYSYLESGVPGMSIMFYKTLEDKDIEEFCVEVVNFDFSTSSDTRWTVDSIHEAIKDQIVDIEIAE